MNLFAGDDCVVPRDAARPSIGVIPSTFRHPATAALALTAFACGELPTEPPAPAPSASFTALHVEGNRIVDADGADRILRGVAVVDPLVGRASRYGPNPSEREIETLAFEWNAGIVRVPMHPDLMSNNPTYLRDHVDPLVKWAGERELYLLLGYHAHGNPLTGEVEDTPWGSNPPWNGNPYNPDLGLALAFNTEIAARYRDRPWVLYSVFNEPAYISWSEWRPVAEKLIDTVRDQHPEALILVSGVDFASELEGALSDPVRRDGIVYEIHPYPWVGESWKKVVASLSTNYPVFLGEWGFGAGHPASMRKYGEALVRYCEELGLGWTAWIWDHSWTPSMFTSWRRTRLTPFGALVKRALAPGEPLSFHAAGDG